MFRSLLRPKETVWSHGPWVADYWLTLYRFWELNPGTLREGSQLRSHHYSSASNLGNVLGSFTTWRLLKLKKVVVMMSCFYACKWLTLCSWNQPSQLPMSSWSWILWGLTIFLLFYSLAEINYSTLFIYDRYTVVQCTKMLTPSGELKTGGCPGSWPLNVQRGSAAEVCLYSCYLSIAVTPCLRKST